MKGDFSRGHAPDSNRIVPVAVDPTGTTTHHYHRVLMQQGRLLLDSDFNAAVDALVTTTRRGVRALGCDAGSPDLGFLVTPGRLLGVWKTADGAQTVSGHPDLYLDHRYKLLNRFPGFYIGTTLPTGDPGPSSAATVRLPLRQSFSSAVSTKLALWVRIDAPTLTFTVNGVSTTVSGPTPEYTRINVTFASISDDDYLEIAIPADSELWVALVEQAEEADDPPFFWVAEGSYHLDGLIVGNPDDGQFPKVSFPEWAGFWALTSPESGAPVDGVVFESGLSSGDLLVAYLEVWEQHLGYLQDSGLIEQALGGDVDTTTRSRLRAQVKIARCTVVGAPNAIAATVKGLFAERQDSGCRLVVEEAEASAESADPCDLPETAGYSGSDNRLYRFEVHQGGPISALLLKWSRDNGSELFEGSVSKLAPSSEPPELTFDADVDLSEGDLVEVLSDVTELGDDALGTVTSAAFVPPGRSVGQLAALKKVEVAGSNDQVIFKLVDPDDTSVPIVLDGRYGEVIVGTTLRLRRWHGTLSPLEEDSASGGPYDIEDGVQISLNVTGTWLPGQYWQYQARVNAENANGPWNSRPHGPERLFTPLGLFEYNGKNKPLKLLAWLDSRFPTLCNISAEDVAFDGDRVGSEAMTVQEALEELYDEEPPEVSEGCGEIVVTPTMTIDEAIAQIPAGSSGRLCFQAGTWNLTGTVVVNGRDHLELHGVGEATQILAPSIERAFHFHNCSSVKMSAMLVSAGTSYFADDLNGVLSFEGVASVDIERVTVATGAAYTRNSSGILVRAEETTSEDDITTAPRVRIHDCRVNVGNMQTGILLNDVSWASVERNVLVGDTDTLRFATFNNHPALIANIGNVFVNRIVMGDDMAMTEPYRNRRRTYIDDLPEWGSDAIFTFDTDPSLVPAVGGGVSTFWRGVMERNPIFSAGTATDEQRANALRKLGRRIARLLLGVPDPSYTVDLTPTQRAIFQSVVDRLERENNQASGGQGIVVGTRHTPNLGGSEGGDARLIGRPRAPEVFVSNNRVDGFIQGIHLGASHNTTRRGTRMRLYKVSVTGNTVLLRVPGFAGERHGIFVGNAHSVVVRDNMVELLYPESEDWSAAKPIDGVRLWGTYGPRVVVLDNHNQGVYTGVRFHPVNSEDSALTGVVWRVGDNAYYGLGSAEVLP